MQMIVWLVMIIRVDKFTVTKSYPGTLKRLISIISWLAFKLNVSGFSKDGQVLPESLGPIDRKFHGHGENDGFVLYEYIINQFISFCKYTNISVMMKKKCQIK